MGRRLSLAAGLKDGFCVHQSGDPHIYDGESPQPAAAPDLDLVALYRGERPQVKIVPGERWRPWMNGTLDRNANRCLPLLMANQSGWALLNPAPFEATWDGGDGWETTSLRYEDDVPEEQQLAKSHFGYGIVTFNLKCVIRTPDGYNVLARGPANSPKDGIAALEGLVETDWAAVPFTMNWKLTRPGSVGFERDEPFCQLVPQRRGELERFRPALLSLDDDAELTRRATAWEASRVMVELGRQSTRRAGSEKWRQIWLSDYFKGRAPTGEENPEHQTKVQLRPFE